MAALHPGEIWDHGCEQIKRRLVREKNHSIYHPEKIDAILSSQEFLAKRPEIRKKILNDSEIIARCAYRGDNDMVEKIIDLGGNINVRDEGGRTALIWASWFGNFFLVTLLIEKECDIDIRDKVGWTAFMVSYERNYHRISLLLMQSGSRMREIRSNNGSQPLEHLNAFYGPFNPLITLPENEDPRDEVGWTLLHWAIKEDDVTIVEDILSEISLSALSLLNPDHITASLLARSLNNERIAQLIEARETPDTIKQSIVSILKRRCIERRTCCQGLIILFNRHQMNPRDLQDENGWDALRLSNKNKHQHFLQWLIELDLEERSRNGSCGTLLHEEVERGSIEVVESMLTFQDIGLSEVNSDLQTPFTQAIQLGQKAIAEVIEAKQTPQILRSSVFNILRNTCIGSKCCKGIKILIKRLKLKIQSFTIDPEGSNPVMLSYMNGHVVTTAFLIKESSFFIDQFNIKDDQGCTLLHRAVEKRDNGTVKLILSQPRANVDLSILNKECQTAFLLAKDLQFEAVCREFEPVHVDMDPLNTLLKIAGQPCTPSEKCCSGLKTLFKQMPKRIQDIHDEHGRSALKLSHYNGHYNFSVHLIRLKADIQDEVNKKDKQGRTLLHRAVERGDEEMVKQILSLSNVYLSMLNENHQTGFILAKDLGHEAIADKIEVKEQGNTFKDALINILKQKCKPHHKCCQGSQILLQKLTDQISDIRDENGSSPAKLSLLNGHYSTSIWLLKFGPRTEGIYDHINGRDKQGWTLIHKAIEKNDGEALELLLSQDVDLSIMNQNFQTPYILARDLGLDIIADYIKSRETADTSSKVLFQSIKSNCLPSKICCQSLSRLISSFGHEIIGITDATTNLSALALAARNGHADFLSDVFSERPPLTDDNKPALIWHAANASQPEALKVLLRHECTAKMWNVDAEDGTNSLTVALLKHNVEIINLMMERDVIRYSEHAKEACTQFNHFKRLLGHEIDFFKHCELAIRANNVEAAKKLFRKLSPRNQNALKSESDEVASVEMREILGLPNKQKSSELVKMTRKYPIPNSKIEENKIKFDNTCLLYKHDIEEHVQMEDYCCIAASNRTAGDQVLLIRDVDTTTPCLVSCTRKEECQSVADMIKLCQLLEQEMSKRKEMVQFRPQLVLIGSIGEGTRIGPATEMDVSIRFDGFNDYPIIIKENATDLYNHSQSFFNDFCPFNFTKFLHWFLDCIHECLLNIDPDEIPRSIKLRLEEFNPESCRDCLRARKLESVYTPFTHCMNHWTTVTVRKVGSCLVFKWRDRVQSIDIIPTFPIQSKGILELFNRVTKTLVKHQYPNWLTHLQKQRFTDVVLPEVLANQQDKEEIFFSAIKILHFGPANNYIIKIAQWMENTNFLESPKLKDVYNYIKVIKCGLNIGVSSYFVKKVLMLPDFEQKCNDDSQNFMNILFEALSHPELKRFFSEKIDFETWRIEGIDDIAIPLQRPTRTDDYDIPS